MSGVILVKQRSGRRTSQMNMWRGIEVVITRRSWKPFVRKGAWVRIPPSPLLLPGVISTPCNFFLANAAGRIKELIQYYVLDQLGEVPKRLKGLPWKGSRSLIAARGFKSLLLRWIFHPRKTFEKRLDKQERTWYDLKVAAVLMKNGSTK